MSDEVTKPGTAPETPRRERLPYVAPSVTWLGRLDDLTQGGVGSLGDKGPGGKRPR